MISPVWGLSFFPSPRGRGKGRGGIIQGLLHKAEKPSRLGLDGFRLT